MPNLNGDLFSASLVHILSQICATCQSDFMLNPKDRFPMANDTKEGKNHMKKFLLTIATAFIPLTLNAATSATGYVAATCDGNYANSSVQAICNDPTFSCSSTGAGVTTRGTYVDYDNCARVLNTSGAYMIICFPNTNAGTTACKAIKAGPCDSDYNGTNVGGAQLSASAINKTVTVYPDQVTCCQSCYGYIYSYPATGVVRKQKATCSTDGVCEGMTGNMNGSYYCDNRYFSAAGTASISGNADYTSLECTPCSNGVDGIEVSDTYSPQLSAAQTKCYIPKNHEIADSTGTYKYTSDCYYTK